MVMRSVNVDTLAEGFIVSLVMFKEMMEELTWLDLCLDRRDGWQDRSRSQSRSSALENVSSLFTAKRGFCLPGNVTNFVVYCVWRSVDFSVVVVPSNGQLLM